MYNYKLTHTKTGLPFHIEKATIPSDFHIHSHDFSELVIAVNGSAIHIVEGSEFTIQAGDVFVINGKTTHGFVNVNNLAIYNLMYDPSIFYQYPDLKQIGGFQALFILEPFFRKEHQFQNHLQLDKEAVKITKTMLNKILREYNEQPVGHVSMIKSTFISLVISLSRKYNSTNSIKNKLLIGIERAITYIENNFQNSISLDFLSNMAVMSERNFQRVFKKIYRISPIDYIVKLRLNMAYTLLQERNLNITEIAYKCGFSDSNYFARRFKKEYDFTPSQIRDKYKK